MGNRKVLLGLTTTEGSDWQAKVKEIDKFRIKELALFPTVLESKERKELYLMLEKTGLERIPHVHLRNDDMDEYELEYFIKKYKAQVFNVHPKIDSYNFIEKHGKYREMIYIENMYRVVNDERFSEKEFKKYKVAGICLDMAHLRSEQLLFPENYKGRIKLLEKFPIGCNHISAIVKKPYIRKDREVFDTHMLSNFSELDYLKEFPQKYFSDIISIELENSLREQLEVKKYIENIINSKK